MTFSVAIQGSGQRFSVAHNESVLEGAIRAGIPLEYGCSNGNCGLCQARVIEGRVAPTQRHEYVIPEADKGQGHILLCSSTPASDLLIDAHVGGVAEIPVQRLRVKVRRFELISDELAILYLQTPRTNRLRFLAGQYATVHHPQAGSHDYAIASCPCDDMRLEFHIRHTDDNPFSRYLFDELKSGDWLEIEAPRGEFVLHETQQRPLLMIAFDTGFAAIKSQLEHLTEQESEQPIDFYWITCGAQGHYMANLCRAWTDALDQFRYTPLSIDAEYGDLRAAPDKGLELGAQCLERIVSEHPALADYDVYMAAPEPLNHAARSLFETAGLLPARFTCEPIRGDPNIHCLMPQPG